MSDNQINYLIKEFRSSSVWLQEQSINSDSNGKPTKKLISYLLKLKINLALVPKKFGGLGFGYIDEFKLIHEAASISGTLGFIVFLLCGNTGRILSFYNDNYINRLLSQSEKVIFCYQDNPYIASVSTNEKGYIVSGKWPFGTLSKIATHFVLSFIEPTTKQKICYLADKSDVQIIDDLNLNGLNGTSTTAYVVDKYFIDTKDIRVILGSNSHFLPNYSIPRAIFKHLSWTLGIWNSINRIFKNQNTLTYEIEHYNNIYNKLIKIIYLIQNDIKINLDIMKYLEKLELMNKLLHSLALDFIVHSLSILPNKSVLIKQRLNDMIVMSSHKAVRSDQFEKINNNNLQFIGKLDSLFQI